MSLVVIDEPPEVAKSTLVTHAEFARALAVFEAERVAWLDPERRLTGDHDLAAGLAAAALPVVEVASRAAKALESGVEDAAAAVAQALQELGTEWKTALDRGRAALELSGAPDPVTAADLSETLAAAPLGSPFTRFAGGRLPNRPDVAKELANAVRVARAVKAWFSGSALARWYAYEKRSGVLVSDVSPELSLALHSPWPVIVLDATADRALLERIAEQHGRKLEVIDEAVRDAAPIERVLIYAANATKKKLAPRGRVSWRTAGPLLAAALRRIGVPNGRKLFLCSFKTIADALRRALDAKDLSEVEHERAKELLATWLAAGFSSADVAHYGAVRGLNRWKDHDAFVSVGDPRPNVSEATDAGLLLGLTPDQAAKRATERAAAELAQVHGRSRAPRRTGAAVQVHVGAIVPKGWNKENARLERMGRGEGLDVRALVAAAGGVKPLARRAGVDKGTVKRALAGRPLRSKQASALRDAAKSLNAAMGEVHPIPAKVSPESGGGAFRPISSIGHPESSLVIGRSAPPSRAPEAPLRPRPPACAWRSARIRGRVRAFLLVGSPIPAVSGARRIAFVTTTRAAGGIGTVH